MHYYSLTTLDMDDTVLVAHKHHWACAEMIYISDMVPVALAHVHAVSATWEKLAPTDPGWESANTEVEEAILAHEIVKLKHAAAIKVFKDNETAIEKELARLATANATIAQHNATRGVVLGTITNTISEGSH